MNTRQKLNVIVILLFLFACQGCGGDGGDEILRRRQNLSELGAAYLDFHAANKASPVNAGELLVYMTESSGETPPSEAIRSLEEGDVVMVYSGQVSGSAADGQHVVGFEAGVPSTGGYVVMGDGEVKLMTSKDFSEASMIPASQ